jgi:hypothetical protein
VGFLRKLASLFGGGGAGAGAGDDRYTHYVYVRCRVCGEPMAIRVDLRNDLSPEWEGSGGSDEPDYYVARKTVVGSGHCYRAIEVELRFNRQRRLESQEASGGTLMSAAEYEQAVADWESKKSAGTA